MQYAFRRSRKLWALAGASALVVLAVVLLATGGSAGAASVHSQHHAKAKHHAADSTLSISRQLWGSAHGQPVYLYTLRNGNRMLVKISNYGGVVQSIWVPGRNGRLADVALGFPKLSDYINDFEHQPWPAPGGSGDTYFGAAIGRYANRIADHSFTLNGVKYNLVGNNGPNNVNTLHGGPNAWNTKVWSPKTSQTGNAVSLALTYVDPNGYNGFPGTVTVTVVYSLTRDNALAVRWFATTTKPTVINVTNHTYFNLAGEGSGPVYDQLLKLNANTFTPTDANLIPTGQFVPVGGTPFDFRMLHPIGEHILDAFLPWGSQLTTAHGYDHNWVLNGYNGKLNFAAQAVDPRSGREVLTYTTEPGIQVYTSNFLVGDLVGTSGHIYRQTAAFTLETQHFPDTPHHIGQPGWPSVVLNPGQRFHSETIYKFAIAH
jgi:aldose 1-epimerase